MTTAQMIETAKGPVECLIRGEGPAVVALHGAMGGWDQSDILAQTIGKENYRYIAITRPGYLGTPLASGRDPKDQAALVAALLDELNVERAIVFAVSGGGPCALQFAIDYPERCRALVLVSTVSGVLTARIPFSFTIMKTLARWNWFVARMQQKVERDFDSLAKQSIPDAAMRQRTLSHPEAGALFKGLTLSTFSEMSKRIEGTVNDIRVTRSMDFALEDIASPTLVIHGTADSVVPFEEHGKVLSERIPGAELLEIEGGEHVSIFTHYDRVRERVARFLDGLALEQ